VLTNKVDKVFGVVVVIRRVSTGRNATLYFLLHRRTKKPEAYIIKTGQHQIQSGPPY